MDVIAFSTEEICKVESECRIDDILNILANTYANRFEFLDVKIVESDLDKLPSNCKHTFHEMFGLLTVERI